MTFLNGCEAIARGAWEGGASFSCSYPGSPVTGIIDGLKRYPEIKTQWVANEKVGMEIAVGIAHSGLRALVLMKHVGLNVAADPFFNVAYTGVRGALVVVVGDDPGAKSSQNEQDTRLLALAAKVPVLEPATIEEALIFTRLAFEISHRFDIPVVVRVTTQLCYGTSRVVTGSRKTVRPDIDFARPAQHYLLLPRFVPDLHRKLNDRLQRLESSHWNRWFAQSLPPAQSGGKYPFGIVVSGFPSAFVFEIFHGCVPILKIGMSFPLNKAEVVNFAERCEQVLVVEESSRFLEQQLRALGIRVAERPHFDGVGEFQPKHLLSPDIPQLKGYLQRFLPAAGKLNHIRIVPAEPASAVESWIPAERIPAERIPAERIPAERIPAERIPAERSPAERIPAERSPAALEAPPRPPGFCAGCSHRGIFYELSKRDLYIVGDIGCYTLGALEPYNALHTNLCMGASIGMLQGYLTAMEQRKAAQAAVAVIGDSTFFHSGIPSLMTAVAAGSPATIIILDNSGAAMTGHQMTSLNFSGHDWERFLGALKVPEFAVIDALGLNRLELTLDRFLASPRLSVMVLKGDCVQGLTMKKPTNYRYTIRTDMCTQCGDCLQVDCPAIVPVWGEGRQIEKMAISNECIGCGLCSQTCSQHAIVPRTLNTLAPGLTPLLARLPWHAVIRGLHRIKPMRRLLAKFEKETY